MSNLIEVCTACGKYAEVPAYLITGWICVCGKRNIWPMWATSPRADLPVLIVEYDESLREWRAHERHEREDTNE